MSRDHHPYDDIDAIFDGDLPETRQGELLGDEHMRREIAAMRRMIFMLKRGPDAPDMADAILARVHAVRSFLPARKRRMLSAGRLGMAACLLLGVVSMALAHRYWPQAAVWRDEPAPVSNLLQTASQQAVSGVEAIEARLGTVVATSRQYAADLRVAVGTARTPPAKIRTRCVLTPTDGLAAGGVELAGADEDDLDIVPALTSPTYAAPEVGRPMHFWAAEEFFAPMRSHVASGTFREQP